MARDLDARQLAELSAFVNAIAEAAGYRTTAEWARESGYPAANLSNLRNGRKGVDGYNLLRLLRAAAARATLTPEQLAEGLARETAADASAESIDRRLKELSDHVARALELLDERTTAETPAEPRERGSAKARRQKAG